MHKRDNLKSILEYLKRRNLTVETIFDIGVAYGTPGLYEVFDNVHYHLIEPLEEYLGVIKNLEKQHSLTYTIAAAGKTETTITLNVHPDLSGSSILNESEGSHVDGIPRNVPQTTIDTEVNKNSLKAPFLIKVDVQGFELEVLKGATATLPKTEVVILEVSLFQFYQNSPTFQEVITFMSDAGFSVYDIFNASYRPLDDALGQIDLLFVRTDSCLRETHHYASKEQREEITKHRVKHLNFKSC